MALGLLGNKIGMTQLFDEFGNIIAVTLIKIGPCVVTQIKTLNTDGYNAIQIGYGDALLKHLNQPQLGHLQKAHVKPLKYLQEYLVENSIDFQVGQSLNSKIFANATKFITVSGITSGKGFSGLQKRHDFARGPMTHGSKSHRAPGSIGMGTTPGRVFPGKRMSGQLGNTQTTLKKLKIVSVDFNNNLLIVKGSIPGKPGNLLNVQIFNE